MQKVVRTEVLMKRSFENWEGVWKCDNWANTQKFKELVCEH